MLIVVIGIVFLLIAIRVHLVRESRRAPSMPHTSAVGELPAWAVDTRVSQLTIQLHPVSSARGEGPASQSRDGKGELPGTEQAECGAGTPGLQEVLVKQAGEGVRFGADRLS